MKSRYQSKAMGGRPVSRNLHSIHPEAFQRFTCLYPLRVGDLVQAGLNPLIAQPQANGQPDPGCAHIREQKFGNGGILNDPAAKCCRARHVYYLLFFSLVYESYE